MSAAADYGKTNSGDTLLDGQDARFYEECVGALYLATVDQPDLAMVVSELVQHKSKPCVEHWQLLEDVLCYYKATQTQDIIYGTSMGALELYSDYGSGRYTRPSRSDYVFMMYGGAQSWSPGWMTRQSAGARHCTALHGAGWQLVSREFLGITVPHGDACFLMHV
jgi:hypothetical protein